MKAEYRDLDVEDVISSKGIIINEVVSILHSLSLKNLLEMKSFIKARIP